MKRVIIAGGTGLIGRQLDQLLREQAYEVRILTRYPEKYSSSRYYKWDVDKKFIDESIFPANIIINLAGTGIANRRWTKKRKKQIIESRTGSSNLLFEAVKVNQNSLDHYIGASAIGFYGDRGDEIITEQSKQGDGFLAYCTGLWENASGDWNSFADASMIFRIGIVLSRSGGAFSKIKFPLNFRMAAYFGNGQQYYSWIHMVDICRMIVYGIENNLSGIYNAVSSDAKTNIDFMRTLQNTFAHSTVLMPVPAFILKFMLGEMSEILLNSNKVSGEKIKGAGFIFEYEKLDKAIASLII